jgi:HEAT repeat protein
MALLATALADGDNDVVEAAGEALARFGKAAVPTLIGLLKSDPPSARWQAAASLGTIGPEAKEAVPALKDRLLDKDTAFAKHYATELAKIGPASLTALQAGFRDERGDVREAAAEGLELLGADAVPFLLDNLREKRLDLRRQAALSLMRLRLGDRQVVLALAAGLADEDSVMRKFCINGLAAAGPNAAPAKARILDALRDFHPHVRGQAATILGTLGENVDEILERGLKSKDARIRLVYGTLMMERSFNDQRPLRPLNDGIDEKAPALRVQAVFGLSRNGTRVDAWIPILVAGLKHQDAGVRVQAARGLSAIGEVRPGADIALAEVLSDPDSEVRYFAVHALRLVIVEKKALAIIARQFNEGDADRRIVMLLLDENRLGDLAGKFRRSAIMDKNERVRRAGLEAIQLQIRGVGPLPHLEELAVLARDEKVEIRIQIAPLLQNGGEKCVPLLIELLKDRDTQVRLSAISTLTAMDKPGKTAVPALETALNDPDRQIRLNAMHAVVKVAGLKDALPALRAATKDGYGLMRVQALHTLTHAGTEKPATLVPPLIDCLKDPDAGVRLQAIYALHFLGAESAAALPRLRELGKSDSDETVRRYAGSVTAPYIESMLLKKQ